AAECVRGPHREAIDVGAVEAGHVNRGRHVTREDEMERVSQRDFLGFQRAQVEDSMKAPFRLIAVDHIKELLLPEMMGGHAFILAAELIQRARHSARTVRYRAPLDAPGAKITTLQLRLQAHGRLPLRTYNTVCLEGHAAGVRPEPCVACPAGALPRSILSQTTPSRHVKDGISSCG